MAGCGCGLGKVKRRKKRKSRGLGSGCPYSVVRSAQGGWKVLKYDSAGDWETYSRRRTKARAEAEKQQLCRGRS